MGDSLSYLDNLLHGSNHKIVKGKTVKMFD